MKSLVRAFVAAALVLHANANLAANCSCAGDRCFSAVRTSVDIRSALRACQEKGGRLATQSPESKVALYPLLDGVQGEFWTGLMLPNEKCTEATRRRSWTAELEATDFTEQTGTGSPCSPLCLSLSKDLMLTERSCEDRVDGYICVYSQVSKCGPLSLEFDKVVLYNSSEHNSLGPCSINAGSIAVHLPSRVKHVCDPDGLWVQAPWGCEFEMGGCQHGICKDMICDNKEGRKM
ncbi:thrombomodulin-like [Arapaima gigas]